MDVFVVMFENKPNVKGLNMYYQKTVDGSIRVTSQITEAMQFNSFSEANRCAAMCGSFDDWHKPARPVRLKIMPIPQESV